MKGSPSDVRFLLVLLAASLALNAFLGVQLITRPPGAAPHPPLAAGDPAPPLELRALDGHLQTRNFTKPTVVYVFAPSCKFCGQNVKNIQHLAQAKAGEFDFVGISLEDEKLAEYLQTHALGFSVYRATAAAQKAYRLGSVPQTLVIDPSGKVLRNWMGAYKGEAEQEVEDFFGTTLPGASEVVDVSSTTTKES